MRTKQERSNPPGTVRDAIISCLKHRGGRASIQEIVADVRQVLGEVPQSSVRSYLNLNTPRQFKRVGRGMYELRGDQ